MVLCRRDSTDLTPVKNSCVYAYAKTLCSASRDKYRTADTVYTVNTAGVLICKTEFFLHFYKICKYSTLKKKLKKKKIVMNARERQ